MIRPVMSRRCRASSRRRKRSCCRQPFRRAAPLRGRMLAGYAKSLPVFLRGIQSLFTVGERTCDRGFQSPVPVFKGCTAFFRNSLCQISDERVHAPHDLHAGSAVKADLIKSQANEIVPRGKWNHESQFAVAVAILSNFQVALAQAQQQVLDLVKRLHRRCRIVDRRRQSLDGYVHKKPDRVLGILFERTLLTELNSVPQLPFINRLTRTKDMQHRRQFHDRIADRHDHLDDSAGRFGQIHQRGDIDRLYRARPSVMNQRLGAR